MIVMQIHLRFKALNKVKLTLISHIRTGDFRVNLNKTLPCCFYSFLNSDPSLKVIEQKPIPTARSQSKLKSVIIPLLLVDSPCGTVYLCALRGYWLRVFRVKATVYRKGGGKCFFSVCQTARRADAVREAPRSPYRGAQSGTWKQSPCGEARSRSAAYAPPQTWALLTVERQGASRWMQGPICLKHTHRAGSDEPSRPSPARGRRDLLGRMRSEERAGRRMNTSEPNSTQNFYYPHLFNK